MPPTSTLDKGCPLFLGLLNLAVGLGLLESSPDHPDHQENISYIPSPPGLLF